MAKVVFVMDISLEEGQLEELVASDLSTAEAARLCREKNADHRAKFARPMVTGDGWYEVR